MNLEELKNQYDVSEHIEESIDIPEMPKEGIVLLVGSSGSGKSTILRSWMGEIPAVEFDTTKSVIENFSSIDSGDRLLRDFGLKSIPTWFRSSATLSNGEFHRAHCALLVDKGIWCIDEFTSVVDRNTAKSLASSIRKHHKGGLLVLASCHRDIAEWLQPDWIYDTDSKELTRGLLQRPSINLEIISSTVKDWVYFKKHHYLSSSISKSVHCYTAYIENKPVAFLAIIHRCGRDIHSYWGECRLVVIPEFQGLGIGIRLSEAIAEEYVSRGLRYFAKTSHPSLGEYRNSSDKWRPTSTNQVRRSSYLKDGEARMQKGFGKSKESIIRDSRRLCYSHEFRKKV